MRSLLFVLFLAFAFPLAVAPAQAQGRSDERRDDRRERTDRRDDRRDRDDRYDDRYRRLDVPPGHLPPRGECRLWYYDRPPGQQPAPERCERLLRYRYDDAAVIDHEGRIVRGRYGRGIGDVLEDIILPRRR